MLKGKQMLKNNNMQNTKKIERKLVKLTRL